MKREKEIKSYKGGEAFKRLLACFAEKKESITELAEVPPWRDKQL